jgi:HEAT repeat protein
VKEGGSPPLLSAAERVRIADIAARAAIGDRAVPELIGRLTDPSWSVRREVIAALGAIGDAAVEPLCRSLCDERDDETRVAAVVDALCASTGDAEGPVLGLVAHPNPAVVADAAQILGRRRAGRAVGTLAQLTLHGDDNVAVAAIEALGRVGGRAAVDALCAAVESRHFFRTFPAIDVLGRSGDPRAVAPLVGLLGRPEYALEAARALGRSGDPAAVSPLVKLLASTADAHVRVAAQALSDLLERQREQGGSSQPGEDGLRKAGSDAGSDAMVRRASQALTGADSAEQLALCEVLGALQNSAAAPVLGRMLDGPPEIASAAALALRMLGQDADAQLALGLTSGDSARRRVLLPLVVRTAAVPAVVGCLQDGDPAVRALACDALGRIGDPRVVGAVFELLRETDARVAQAAIGAIQSLGSAETESLALSSARSPLPAVRRAAMRLLSYFGYPSAYEVFAAAVHDPDLRVRDAAIAGLAFVEHAGAVDLLLAAADDPSERTRAAAMRGLGQSPQSERIVGRLRLALSDDDAWVRYYACQALGRLGVEEAAGLLRARLEDAAGHVRVAALEALSHLKDPRARSALGQAAQAADPDIQRAALIGLGLTGDPDALPTLLAAADTGDAATRLIALSALAPFDSASVAPALERATRDPDAGVRAAALGSLASRSGPEATAILIGLLGSDEAGARAMAALASPIAGRVHGVLGALQTADDELAPRLTTILTRLHREQPGGALLEALRSPNPAARKAAAGALRSVGSQEAMAALKQRALHDDSDEVRRVCALLLSQ